MRNELELLELVDRYLEGTMDAMERMTFEQRLAGSADLRALLEDQRVLREGIARVALRPAVAKAYRAHRFGKWKPWLGGASIVIIAAVGLDLWHHHSSEAPPEMEHEAIVDTMVDAVDTLDTVELQQREVHYTVDTIIDSVYRVMENGKWRTVKERPEGAQTLADGVPSPEPGEHTVNEASTTVSRKRDPLPVRMEPMETKPEFPGGMGAFYTFLETNIQHPDLAKPLSGTIEVGFTIDATGGVTNAEIVKGLDPAYNAEALRVIRSMPKWKPAEQGGKPVPCRLQMPMQFKNPGAATDPTLK